MKLFPLALAASSLLFAGSALADDTGMADALFGEAKALAEKGEWAAACPKFQASYESAPALGTLLNLADCLEHQGLRKSAYDRWSEAIELAEEKKDDRAVYAKERRSKLEGRLASLTLDITQASEKLAVEIEGKELGEAKFGLPVQLDAGEVKVTVLRGDVVLETKTVKLVDGEAQRLALDLAAIAKAHPPSKAAAVEAADPTQRYAGIAVLSTGLAGVAAFGVLEGVAFSKRSAAESDGLCVAQDSGALVCTPAGYEEAQLAGTLAEVGQWVGVGGLAVAAVGLTVFLTAPKDAPAEKAVEKAYVVPILGPGRFGIVAGGVW